MRGPGDSGGFAPVAGIGNVVEVVTGTGHAWARLADGLVRCWGDGMVTGDGSEGPATATPGTARCPG